MTDLAANKSSKEQENVQFECSMHTENSKIFANAVQCLARNGKDIILAASTDSKGQSTFSIRTLNDSKTSFTVFTFHTTFFETFHIANKGSNGLAEISGKFPLKACLCAFRSIRTVERFQVSFVRRGIHHIVLFTGFCKGGLVKRHEFNYEDTEILDAELDLDKANIRISAWTTTFTSVLKHFQAKAEELLLVADTTHGVKLQTYHLHVDRRTEFEILKTAIRLGKKELDSYIMDGRDAVELTFGLREFKSYLHFCESSNVGSISLCLSEGGQPLLVTTDITKRGGVTNQHVAGRTFYAELLLATYVPETTNQHSSQESNQLARTQSEKRPMENQQSVSNTNAQEETHEQSASETNPPEDANEESQSSFYPPPQSTKRYRIT